MILIGSINSSRGKFGTSAYSASKAGRLSLAKGAARELARFGVLFNVIEPGWIKTPMTEATPQKVREAALGESLVGSFVDPEDIAAAVVFFAAPGGAILSDKFCESMEGSFLDLSEQFPARGEFEAGCKARSMP